MPSAWNLIDSSFPVFTGNERVKDQIPVILNYMYMLSEGLRYQLSNLSGNNWNSTALDKLKVETTADLVKQMETVAVQIQDILSQLNSHAAKLLQTETDISDLEKTLEELNQGLSELDERLIRAEGSLMALEDVFVTDGEGGAVIGGVGKDIHINGNVYINGKKFQWEV